MAERFGLEEIRGHVLNTKGVTRVNHGDLGGIADAEESIAIAERLNSAEALIRGYKNFGSTLMELGDLPRATELEQRGLEVALRFGLEFQVMWFETELGILAYWSGDWDAADQAFGRLRRVGRAPSGRTTWRPPLRATRAKLRSARGDQAGAAQDIEDALAFARRSLDLQSLLPTLADAALISASTGAHDAPRRVSELFDEAVGALANNVSGAYCLVEFALALALTDQAGRFVAVSTEGAWRWLSAARLIAAGSYTEAADELAAIGARPEEALARLLAARMLIGRGDRAGGEAELHRALDFWRSVGAARHLEMAEAMLAKSA